MSFFTTLEPDRQSALAKNYPNLTKSKRIDRIARELSKTTYTIPTYSDAEVSGEDILSFMITVLCGEKIQAGFAKEINKSLDKRDVHLFNRKQHQNARDQDRIKVLTQATALILDGSSSYNLSSQRQGIGSSASYRSTHHGGNTLYKDAIFDRIALNTWESINPSLKARAEWQRQMDEINKEKLKRYQEEEARRKQEAMAAMAARSRHLAAIRAAGEFRRRDGRRHTRTSAERSQHLAAIRTAAGDYRERQGIRATKLELQREEAVDKLQEQLSIGSTKVKEKLTSSFQRQGMQFDKIIAAADNAYQHFKEACEKDKEAQVEHEKFKVSLAKGLGKVLTLAPPPLSLVGSIVTGGAAAVLEGVDSTYKQMSEFFDAQANDSFGVDGVQEKTDVFYAKFKEEAKKRGKIWETAPPPGAEGVIRSETLTAMMKNFQTEAMNEAILLVDQVTSVDAFTTEESFKQANKVNHQRADALLSALLSEEELRKIAAENIHTASDFYQRAWSQRVKAEVEKFYAQVDSAGIGWYKPESKETIAEHYIELWLWGLFFRTFHLQTKKNSTLPQIWPAAVARLKERGFLSEPGSGSSLGTGRVRIPYRNSITGRHASDRFYVYYVLVNWVNNGPSPMELLFNRNMNKDGMEKAINGTLQTLYRAAKEERDNVHKETSFAFTPIGWIAISSRWTRDKKYKKRLVGSTASNA